MLRPSAPRHLTHRRQVAARLPHSRQVARSRQITPKRGAAEPPDPTPPAIGPRAWPPGVRENTICKFTRAEPLLCCTTERVIAHIPWGG